MRTRLSLRRSRSALPQSDASRRPEASQSPLPPSLRAVAYLRRWTGRLLAGGLTACLGVGLTGCGGGGAAEPAPTAALRLDSPATVTQTMGPSGGTLVTTAADGNTYTLTVPPRALRSATVITLAPIAAIGDLPAGVSLAGGAHLAPEGQRFDMPIRLELVLAAPTASAPAPFAYSGELQRRHLYPATVTGRTIAFEIVHFSGYAALNGVLGDLLGYFPAPSERGDRALQELVEARLLGLDAPQARDAAMLEALQGWLDDFIKPEVTALVGRPDYDFDGFLGPNGRVTQLASELRTFGVAVSFALLEATSFDAIVALRDRFQLEVMVAARRAIDLSSAGCSAFPDHAVVLIAPDILAWQQLAQLNGVVEFEESLRRQTVLDALCVKAVYASPDGVSLAADIQPGQTGLLTVRAGYSINAGPARFDLPMVISTAGALNVSPSERQTFEIGAGQVHAQPFQWHAATDSMLIDVSACFAEPVLAEVCQRAFVVRSTPDAPPPPPPPPPPPAQPPAGTCPSYRVTAGMNTATGSDWSTGAVLPHDGVRGGSMRRNLEPIMSTTSGTIRAVGVLHFRVDASFTDTPGGVFAGRAFWRTSGGGSGVGTLMVNAARRALAVDGLNRTFAEQPFAVRHGEVMRVELDVTIDAEPSGFAQMTDTSGVVFFDLPDSLKLTLITCP
jgi:hypothetical protein